MKSYLLVIFVLMASQFASAESVSLQVGQISVEKIRTEGFMLNTVVAYLGCRYSGDFPEKKLTMSGYTISDLTSENTAETKFEVDAGELNTFHPYMSLLSCGYHLKLVGRQLAKPHYTVYGLFSVAGNALVPTASSKNDSLAIFADPNLNRKIESRLNGITLILDNGIIKAKSKIDGTWGNL